MIKILIIGDDTEMVAGFAKYIGRKGIKVFTADDAMTALIIAKEEKPEIIILDAAPDEESGFDILKKIKKMDGIARVIMTTDHLDRAFAIRSFQSGAYDYMSKPLDYKYIEKIIKTI